MNQRTGPGSHGRCAICGSVASFEEFSGATTRGRAWGPGAIIYNSELGRGWILI